LRSFPSNLIQRSESKLRPVQRSCEHAPIVPTVKGDKGRIGVASLGTTPNDGEAIPLAPILRWKLRRDVDIPSVEVLQIECRGILFTTDERGGERRGINVQFE
jgi:hypothetical protein